MEIIGEIEIKVVGKTGDKPLKPENFDIKLIVSLLQDLEDLLYPNNKKERPLITYDIKEGSVKHVFKTSMQSIIGFSAILTQIRSNNSIDFLELKTARAIENIQHLAVQKNYEFLIKTSLNEKYELTISPSTKFISAENFWADAEFYFYGVLKDAGGKNKANIHIDTEDYGYLPIETSKEFLKDRQENFLYKKVGIRAIGKQNTKTGELDNQSLKLVELIDYDTKFDDDYLKQLILKAKKNWQENDPDKWLNDVRGDYET